MCITNYCNNTHFGKLNTVPLYLTMALSMSEHWSHDSTILKFSGLDDDVYLGERYKMRERVYAGDYRSQRSEREGLVQSCGKDSAMTC